jgi:hypothetical protein
MNYMYQIVCLANSRKLSGRCIAGKLTGEPNQRSWLRPVGISETHEITELDREYIGGSTANKLDIINIVFSGVSTHAFQQENHVIDDTIYWEKVGSYPVSDIVALVDSPTSLWENGFSSYSGVNDRVPISMLTQHRQTLYIIIPADVVFSVMAEGANFGSIKRHVRAHFTYQQERYALKVTDPDVEKFYKSRPDGEYPAAVSYFTVSLGESYSGYAYKLVAAVF